MKLSYGISPLGDNALLIQFGNRIDEALNKQVLVLFKKLKAFSLPIIDVVPAYCSLAVYYDVLLLHGKEQTAFEKAKQLIESVFNETEFEEDDTSRRLKIPVCYSSAFGFDLTELAHQKNVSTAEIIQWHTSRTYRVYMVGFLPGFAYMGKIDNRLATPRKMEPRINVPEGSVGIAGEQTGIYPIASPGGWNIIGCTPLKIFDASKADAVLFQPGDEVEFYSITEDEFENYQSRNS